MRHWFRLDGQSLKEVLGEVYLERACRGNPVVPEVVHHLLKREWTTQERCGKGVERLNRVASWGC